MDIQKGLLIETDLYWRIMVLREADDPKRLRETFFWFCKENDIDEEEALAKFEEYVNYNIRVGERHFEQYTDVRSILYPQENTIATEEGETKKSRSDDDEDR